MRNSFFNRIIFIFHIITILLLGALCLHLNIFEIKEFVITKETFIKSCVSFLKNDYVVNILCTALTAISLYIIQIKYSKYKLKKDFRCNEIICELYDCIERVHELIKESEYISNENNRQDKARKYIEFYSKNKTTIYLSHIGLTYHNNDILIDSIHTVFFINLNFKLLNIVNNIKNRIPNLIEEYPKIENLYEKYKESDGNIDVALLGFEIERYLVDMRFMANYYDALLSYLGYDPIPSKLYCAIFNEMFPSPEEKIDYYRLSASEQNKISKKIIWRYCKGYFIYKIKNFFE